MNPCVVTVDVFGEESSFEVSSHEYAVSITDTFQDRTGVSPRFGGETMRHDMPHTADAADDGRIDDSFWQTFGNWRQYA